MKKNSDRPDASLVNPAAFGEEIRAEALPNVDHAVMDESGKRRIADDAHYREEHRAVNLGHASGHASLASDLEETVRPAATEHAGQEAFLGAAEPRRDNLEQQLAADGKILIALKAVPNNTIDPRNKTLGNIGKLVLGTGDLAVLAIQLWRSGTPLPLALLVGLALAGTVIAVGTVCGHRISTAHHRQERGPIPVTCVEAVRYLYDSGNAEENYRFWLRLAVLAGCVMLVSLFLLGRGGGDPSALALGYGLLGSLTVAGSCACEAYATNEAADQLTQTAARMERTGAKLGEFEVAETRSATARVHADVSEQAARHRALATATTVTSIANRLPDTPEVAGYVDGGHVPVTEAPPAPVERIIPHTPTPVQRRRTRPTYDLGSGLIVPNRTDGDEDDGSAGMGTISPHSPDPFAGPHLAPIRGQGNDDELGAS